ncbi:hypothetical protein [Novosphingobium album (ex Liu et al. 2023)]|uniref:SGNH/GDSL hydrolase family protein n=1 Tax=Novosphingobium album (ex Liu et al. 2023) TaxID=3031130 RepID=A0ABT5WQC2_9SPHN|nr:hypothetical protein [Novosphingobium album (ex Liu et al. 2023)]MDE8652203.1 hypothetical protein [Novosphingobium album (ex Liu et al. 2023)]
MAFFVACFLTFCGLALLLPHSRYIRYQQLAGSAMAPGVWIFERTRFDRTPIDVAIVGASRTEVAISAPRLQAILSHRLGRPIHVANLAMPKDGRDLHYALTRQLLETHPEVRLIIYSVIEHPSRTGHPAFRSVADSRDVVSEPLLLNPSYLENLAYLPYRQISLFVQTLLPKLFAVRTRFDSHAYWGTDYDSTRSYRSSNGGWVDRDSIRSSKELATSAAREFSIRKPRFLPTSGRDYEYAIERQYTEKIYHLARQHGMKIAFIYLPVYAHAAPIEDLDFYRSKGRYFNASFMAGDFRNYSDYGHANRIGSARVTDWLAGQLSMDDLNRPPSRRSVD